MRPLQKILSLIFLTIFISVSLVVAPQSQAVKGPTLFEELKSDPKTTNDYLKEYCDKRSGDLMNLETWYSGKCAAGTDTLSGDGIGFSDIVILQGMEYLYGPQYDSFLDSIIKKLKIIEAIKEKLSSGEISPSQINLSEVNGGGLLPSITGLTAQLVTARPASSADYLAYVSSNLKSHHVISEAYAAGPGYGFSALAPILPLWRAFRNISYILFALGFVLYGVMIMFRIKIDAKTAASVQLAIPKLIVTLLIITFSYAIVGFLIDISTVISAMVFSVLKAGGILADVKYLVLPAVAGGQTFLGALGSMVVNGVAAIIVSPFIFFNLIIGGLAGIAVATVAIIATPSLGFWGVIFGIIIILAVAISYSRLILKLFQAYFSIIVSLIFSPIILLQNLMPGSNAISTWLMSIIGNLAVFPVASFFLVLSYALMCQPLLSIIPSIIINASGFSTGIGNLSTSVGNPSAGGFGFNSQAAIEGLLGVKSLSTISNLWTPPMTLPGNVGPGTYTGSVGSLTLATIGFGLLMMASKYCEMVEKALKTPPFPYGAAISESLKQGTQYAPMFPGFGTRVQENKYYQAATKAIGITPAASSDAPWGTGSAGGPTSPSP